jgi:hypothetical protein
MKAAALAFLLLAVCGTAARAQSSAATATSNEITIKLREGAPEYCLGPHPGSSFIVDGKKLGPDAITLRLPLKVRYENRGSETILLPAGYNFIWRMTVAGQNESTFLRKGGGGSLPGSFITVAGKKPESSTVPESETLTFHIPQEPLTRNCMITLPK